MVSENGWIGLPVTPEYGGQGLPMVIAGQVNEYFSAANVAFQIYPGLAAGAGHLIESFGTDEDKSLFWRKDVDRRLGRNHVHDRTGRRIGRGLAADQGRARPRRRAILACTRSKASSVSSAAGIMT